VHSLSNSLLILKSLPVQAVLHTTVAAATAPNADLCFNATIKNVGAAGGWTSDVVVLGFIKSALPDSAPNAKLFDFRRIAKVAPGAAAAVRLCVDALAPTSSGGSALALVDVGGKSSVRPGTYTLTAGVKGGVGGAGAGGVIGTIVVAAA